MMVQATEHIHLKSARTISIINYHMNIFLHALFSKRAIQDMVLKLFSHLLPPTREKIKQNTIRKVQQHGSFNTKPSHKSPVKLKCIIYWSQLTENDSDTDFDHEQLIIVAESSKLTFLQLQNIPNLS